MDGYAKSLLGIAAMICVVILSTALVSRATAPQEEEETQAAPAVAAAWSDAAEEPYFVVLRAAPEEPVVLTDQAGTELQTCLPDADGTATLGPIAPGCYCVRQGGCGGSFRLEKNASVAALDGTLWSDGELLHLAQTETVCLRLEVAVEPALAGQVVTVELTAADGERRDRSFVAGDAGVYTVQFSGLPPGIYEVRQNGRLLRLLTVTQAGAQQILLAG